MTCHQCGEAKNFSNVCRKLKKQQSKNRTHKCLDTTKQENTNQVHEVFLTYHTISVISKIIAWSKQKNRTEL